MKNLFTIIILLISLNGFGQKSNYDLLQGKWQHIKDKTNFLVFEKDHRKEVAAGMNKWDDEKFVLSNKCLSDQDKNNELKKEKDKYISVLQRDMCWYIVVLNATTLELSYMGRGNSLVYKKVK